MLNPCQKKDGDLSGIYFACHLIMNSVNEDSKIVLILENDKDLADSIRLYLEDSYQVYTIQDPEQLKIYIKKYLL